MCGNRGQTQYTSGEIDILAGYLIPLDVWYIIPVEKIQNRWLLFFPTAETGAATMNSIGKRGG